MTPIMPRTRAFLGLACAAALAFTAPLAGCGNEDTADEPALSASELQELAEDYTEDDIEELLSKNDEVLTGTAENDFVEESPYELTSFQLDDKQVDSDTMTTEGTVAIKNEYFSESYDATIEWEPTDTGWKPANIERDNERITPQRGISHDDEMDLSDISADDAVLSSDSLSCTVSKIDDTESGWWGSIETKTDYSYRFNGTRWARNAASNTYRELTSIEGIEGSYNDPRGEATEEHGYWSLFEISLPESSQTTDETSTSSSQASSDDEDNEVAVDISWKLDTYVEAWVGSFMHSEKEMVPATGSGAAQATLTINDDGTVLLTADQGDTNLTVTITQDGQATLNGEVHFERYVSAQRRDPVTANVNNIVLQRS